MRNILFVISVFLFIGCAFSQFPIGNQVFYATLLNTNGAYGSGASFPGEVWFNGNLGLMRVDYKNPTSNAVFMSVFYNYTSHDKYEVCGSSCARATWNAQMPVFSGSSSTYSAPTSCVTPDWPGPRACVSNCRTYVANPSQPQGIWSLSYNETSGAGINLCLVRWSVQTGQNFGPEWHIQKYYTSSFPSSNPVSASTYSSVIAGVTCPQPTCFTVLDLSIIVDESGSIWSAGAWGDVQNFVLNLINSFTLAPDRVRAGLAYFSGQDSCSYNWTGTSGFYNSACRDNCGVCGGRWDNLTPNGLVTDKTGLYKLAYDHSISKGFTCISCGLDIGIKMLNIAPKANVQKLIILFTDGAQNRVYDSLQYQGNLAKSQGTNVIAVATGGYKLSDLQVFTNTIYTSTTYAGLSDLIRSIVSPLCQPLANIDTCDFCSGLCSCTTTCNCPNCNDYNLCTNERCDIRPPPDGTLGSCVYTNVNCDDNNPCTQNLCSPSTGCNYTLPTPAPTGPSTNNYCNRWACSNPQGFTFSDVGTGLCAQGSNLCLINYCNSTIGNTGGLAGSCVSKNLGTDIPYGQTYIYTRSDGITKTAIGCAKPSNALPCYTYTCNPSDGSCSFSTSACRCQTSADCDDSDGCTVDVCDTVLNQCNHTRKDCWSEISLGGCKQGQTGTTSNVTGLGYWSGTTTFNFNGNLPATSNYNCDQMSCFGGKQSTYTCLSTGSQSYQCQRQTVDCTSGGCVDNICRSLGTWTNGQYNTNCSPITRTCNDASACTTDSCKSSFTGSSCTQSGCPMNTNRCTFSNITCNDNNACTVDRCLVASGCDYSTPVTIPPSTNCFTYSCDAVKGIVKSVKPNACPSVNKCQITYCNTSTDSCQAVWDKSTHLQSESTSFTDEYGVSQVYYGCLNTTALPLSCLIAKCNSTTGSCFIDTSGCSCISDAQCNDGNGCTDDKCTGSCVYTQKDCWSQFSNGGCTIGSQTGQPNTGIGIDNYNQGSPDNTFTAPTTTYNCSELACYSGRRSQYACQSLSSSTFQCNRVASNCAKGGCLDTVCRTLGTWTNGQYDTDCGTNFSPTCVSNGCNVKSCNSAFSYVNSGAGTNNNNLPNTGDARCNIANNGTSCNDNNLCTLDQCFNSTVGGCDFKTQTTDPFTPNFCLSTSCDPTSGWQQINNGANVCSGSNLCQIKYCNTTLGGCSIVDRSQFAVGQTVFYKDSDGLTKSVTGCGNPVSNDPYTCRQYGCDANTGLCTVNIDNCQCLNDATCQDGNGCTNDKCMPPGVCQRTAVDCFSYFSNGQCTQGMTYAADNTVGLTLYNNVYLTNGNSSNYAAYTSVDSNGYPSPSQNVNRTCSQLACYNGAPSNYTCFSLAEGSFTCQRSSLNCSTNGCQDNICQSLGTWNTNNQMDSNCGLSIRPSCVDNNACTSDYCDIAWTPQSSTPRCRHDTLNGTSFCDDGNFCTDDYCDQQDTSGNVCKHRLYADWYVRKYLCKKTKVCQTVQCTVNKCIYTYIGCNAPTLCTFFTCNKSTNGSCKAFPTGAYKIDSCGVCAGNGLSCLPTNPGSPKKTSIAVALGVGLGVGLFFALLIIGIITRTSYAAYLALGTETLGTVTTSPTYEGAENHLDTNDYHRKSK